MQQSQWAKPVEPENRLDSSHLRMVRSLGHNSIEAMVQIATDPEASLELRGRMNAELAQYVYPSRKAVEIAATRTLPPCTRLCLRLFGPRKCLPSKADGHPKHG